MSKHKIFERFIREYLGEHEFFVPCKEKTHAKSYNAAMLTFQTKFKQVLSKAGSNYSQEELTRMMETKAHNPQYTGIGPYKLHVTLAKESYTPDTIDRIQSIIEKYNHAVFNYKYVNAEKIEDDLASLESWDKFLTRIKQKVKNEEDLSTVDKATFAALMRRYEDPNTPRQKQWRSWMSITPEIIIQLKKSVIDEKKQQQKASDRFLKGDQFTIYIPPQYDKESILQLCQEINLYLNSQGAEPGITQNTEKKLGKFINFRQELLIEDFKALYKDSSGYKQKRISALETDEGKVKQITAEMDQSELFKYLSLNIDKPAPKNKWQVLWENTTGTDYDKAVALLSTYCGTFKDSGTKGTSYWGGSIGRFFAGRWGTNHGNEVQNALNQSTVTPTLQNLLDKLQDNLQHKELKPDGDLNRILTTIGANSNYGQTEEMLADMELENNPDLSSKPPTPK